MVVVFDDDVVVAVVAVVAVVVVVVVVGNGDFSFSCWWVARSLSSADFCFLKTNCSR